MNTFGQFSDRDIDGKLAFHREHESELGILRTVTTCLTYSLSLALAYLIPQISPLAKLNRRLWAQHLIKTATHAGAINSQQRHHYV
jgi:hypothetical protein